MYDETLDAAQELQRGDAGLFKLEAIDFGRRISIEKEMEGSEGGPSPNAVFDASGNFIIYATLLGIKVSSPSQNTLLPRLGHTQSAECFPPSCAFQSKEQHSSVRPHVCTISTGLS